MVMLVGTVQPISTLNRHRTTVSQPGYPGRHRWLSCFRDPFDVAGARSRRTRDDGPRRVGFRRRSRRPA
jgi:hypothetical protein